MHYFLTGERQVGKTTIINRIIKETGLTVGGFRTSFGADRFSSEYKNLYMYDASKEFSADDEHIICRMSPEGIYPDPDKFDKLGVRYINRGIEKKSELLIMDECGRLEKDASLFRHAVINALDNASHIVGVIQIELPLWTQAIYDHPNVELITVTVENREAVTKYLINKIKENL